MISSLTTRRHQARFPAHRPTANTTSRPIRLSAFNGEEAAGTWQLKVDDNYTNDGGSLNGWALQICATQANDPADSLAESYSAFAYDGQAIGTAPTKGNPTLTRGYYRTTPLVRVCAKHRSLRQLWSSDIGHRC